MPLNKNDLNLVRLIVEEVVGEINKNLPTKNEFFTAMDELMTEIKTTRQEQTIHGHQITNHETRIQKIESYPHSPTS